MESVTVSLTTASFLPLSQVKSPPPPTTSAADAVLEEIDEVENGTKSPTKIDADDDDPFAVDPRVRPKDRLTDTDLDII